MEKVFRTKLSYDIFKTKYSHDGSETWGDLAYTLVKQVVEPYKNLIGGDETVSAIYKMIREMKFIPGGRYLYYAGRSVPFFNNCYLLKAEEDTREDWANLSWKSESALLTGGGIGSDYTVYRPSGATISRTGGTASGPIPKMEMINEIGRNVKQGSSRRSAIYASLLYSHGDADQFLKAKNWHDRKVAGTDKTYWDVKNLDWNFPCPLDMTNISLNYNTKWLMDYYKTGDFGEVFLENVVQALTTGEPGFSFNFFDKENETLRNACVTGDTLILTSSGYIPIESSVGKSIRIWNGESWETVTPFSTGVRKIYRVTLSDGTHLDCTSNHKWCIDGGFVETKDLKFGMELDKFSMPTIALDKYDVYLSKRFYSQGFYSGDGNRGYDFSWVYDTKYECIPNLIGEIREAGTKRKLWKHDLMLDKSFVPVSAYFHEKMSWLAGLLDSDGTVTRDKNGSGFQIASVDHDFLNKVRLMLTTLGVQAKVVKGKKGGMYNLPDGRGGLKKYKCKEIKRLLIGNYDAWYLMHLGLGKLLRRIKHNGIRPQRDARRFVRVVSVENLNKTEMTYCFTEPKTSRGTFNGIVTGQCTEVTSEDDSDVCNLGSVNLSRIDSIEELRTVVELGTLFLLLGTLVAKLPYKKIEEVREKNRRLGLGLMGIHEWLLQRGYKYEVVPELHSWLDVYRGISDKAAKTYADVLGVSRPVAVRSIAPTGTIGMVAGTTTGIEPVYAVAYKRRYLKGTKWHYQYAIDTAAQTLIDETGVDPEKVESAIDLATDYERRIKFQADVQDYVDMAISSTINLPPRESQNFTTKEFATVLARYAPRLRGFTCYPDGSRGGQPLTSVPYKEAVEHLGTEFEESLVWNDVCDITGGGYCGT